jgi:hypothetical protein
MSAYCAWFVSWYSSTRTYRKRRWYSAAMSGNARNRKTVCPMRSSKSNAFARRSSLVYRRNTSVNMTSCGSSVLMLRA